VILGGMVGEEIYPPNLLSLFVSGNGEMHIEMEGGLPAGLTLNQDGTITGTPTTAGNTSVIIHAVDSQGQETSITLQIEIAPAPVASPPQTIEQNINLLKENMFAFQKERRHRPIDGIEQDPRTEMEGTFISINLKDLFTGSDVNRAMFSASGLPPGLRVENDMIIGQLAQGSAGDYTIAVTVSPPVDSPDPPVILTFSFKVVPYEGGYFSNLFYQQQQASLHYNYSLQLAQQNPPQATIDAFTTSYSQISLIPYSNLFNCDGFGTCLQLAAQNSYWTAEFRWAIEVTQQVALPSIFGDIIEAVTEQKPPPVYTTSTVYHEVSLVWLGRTENGLFDWYGIYEPQQGNFVTTYITNASDENPTSIPQHAWNQYIQASGFVPAGATYVPHPTIPFQALSTTPSIHPGNTYSPLTWYFLTQYYLSPNLAQQVQSGLGQIQIK
jgi:hypothetical protein